MTTATLTAEQENPDTFLHHVKVALKNAGFMQVITHDNTGTVVCAGYQLLPRTAQGQNWARLEFCMKPAQHGETATQQQRMKVRHAMTAAYTAVLEAAGFRVIAGVTGITNRPYLNVSQGAHS